MANTEAHVHNIHVHAGGIGVAASSLALTPAPRPVLESGARKLPNKNPSFLLNARHQIVPFHEPSRREELEELQRWCVADDPLDLRLWHGSGGVGKTRLMVEWCQRLEREGWTAGFLIPSRAGADPDAYGAALRALCSGGERVFVVVDYAETHRDLGQSLAALFEAAVASEARLRVVLLARQVGDWWSLLQSSGHDLVRDLLCGVDPAPLRALAPQGQERRAAFEHALSAFSTTLNRAIPAQTPPDLEDAHYERPLYLHMLALAVLEGDDTTPGRLLEITLHRERSLWNKALAQSNSADFIQRASLLMSALTLLGGVDDEDSARALSERVGGPAEAGFVTYLHNQYGPLLDAREAEARYIYALEPDLLGEALVKQTLSQRTDAPRCLTRIFDGADERALLVGLTLLSRIGLSPDQSGDAGRRWARHVLTEDLPNRALPALRAALSLAKKSAHATLGRDLTDALEQAQAHHLASQLAPLLPDQTVSLRELALWVTEAQLHHQGPLSDEERAHLLNNLGGRLRDLGRREDALEAAQEAVNIRRQLAQLRLDVFLHHLAASLNNLGVMLSEVGRSEEALEAAREAADLYRQLAHLRPDTFLPILATSLSNLSTVLRELGRREQALEAAQEAADLDHQLAQLRPDAFLPGLAASLNNLGAMLRELGRYEQALEAAQEAVNIRRQLAQLRPDAFLPSLAGSLHNLGGRLGELGRHEDALEAAREAVQVVLPFYLRLPEAFGDKLGMFLGNYWRALEALGLNPEADPVMQEARRALGADV